MRCNALFLKLQLMQLLLLLLREAYLLGVQIKIHPAQLLLLHEFVLAGGRTVLLVLRGGVVAGEGRCLRREELRMLTVQLVRGHALELALGAHILATFRQPFLHNKPALLPPLDGRVSARLRLRLILRRLALARRHGHALVLPDSCQRTFAICFPMVYNLVVGWARRVARSVLVRTIRSLAVIGHRIQV